jgi:tetratricopeptide (TPR) repeat protein
MMNKWSSREALLLLVVFIGLASVVGLSRMIDSRRPSIDAKIEEEQLYVNGKTVKRISLGFNGLAADWYWMRALQYVGRKVLNTTGEIQLDDLGQLNVKLLAPLLDTATTLDPEFMEPYEYAAVVLPGVNVEDAIRIARKGIAVNPSAWRLYQHLGYIYWQQKDFKAASEAYGQGAALPGAPHWMEAMKAQMLAQGGSRNTARLIYERMYQQTDDPYVREMARRRLLQIQSLVGRDEIRRVLGDYAAREQRCVSSWKDVSDALRRAGLPLDATGVPLDPANVPYRLVKAGCDVDLDLHSEVPQN